MKEHRSHLLQDIPRGFVCGFKMHASSVQIQTTRVAFVKFTCLKTKPSAYFKIYCSCKEAFLAVNISEENSKNHHLCLNQNTKVLTYTIQLLQQIP